MKAFVNPDLKVIRINQRDIIATSGIVNNVYSNNSMIFNGGWWGYGRAPERNWDWDGTYEW